MPTYLFKTVPGGSLQPGALAISVQAALDELCAQDSIRPQRWGYIETPSSDGPYVLLSIEGPPGWHYHQGTVFDRHGITCVLYPGI